MKSEDLKPYFEQYPDEVEMIVVGEGIEKQVFLGSEKQAANNYTTQSRSQVKFKRDDVMEGKKKKGKSLKVETETPETGGEEGEE